jgi:subtilase family serine protease
LPRPRSVRMAETSSTAVPRSGSGENGAFFGNDFRAAYLPEVTLTGAGQILGMVQFDGFYPADIAAYETAASLPQVPLQTVLLDGYDGVPTSGANSGNGEVSLDIEMAVCMAPGLSKIVVFEAGPNGFQNDILSAMASHAEIKQLSCSWGWGGGPSTTTDNLFKKMAAQGQSFFSASGDSDAFSTGAVDDPSQVNSPSSSPYITVVGGVTLTTSGPGGARASEAVWNRGDGVGSSGGISSHYAIPSWQAGINMTANGGSTGFRNTPDVAWVAENISVRYGNGITGSFGGTSCAAPLWAGLAALMNQQAVEAGKPSIGFINPAIYALGKGAGYGSLFNDVTNGNNTWSGSANAFDAVAGFDLCTGWGSPAGQHLIDALAGPLTSVKPLPSLAFTSIEKSVSGCKLSWQSADALRYQLQSTADLLSSNWLNVGPVITGTGQVITAEDPGATDPSAPRFYRLLRTQ